MEDSWSTRCPEAFDLCALSTPLFCCCLFPPKALRGFPYLLPHHVFLNLGISSIIPLTDYTIRHMGRCIYGGIYDPGNPLSDSHGYRTDVLSALRELDIPVIRYPGGNFIATYHWQDGVGPRENRPSRPELAWLGTETNQFGL